ncbi:MAG: phage holin family protein [Solirubrobacteraceae bacterium]
MADNNTSDLGQAIQDVSEKAALLVREEIELAKAEVTEKVSKLIKGAVVGIVAGIFAVAGLIYLLHAAAWAIWELFGETRDFWIGFVIIAVALFVLGAIAGFVAARFLKKGAPPTPAMAIEEAQLIKETVTSPHPGTPQGTPARSEVSA